MHLDSELASCARTPECRGLILRGRPGWGDGVTVVFKELGDGSRRQVKHWLGHKAEEDCERNQRREDNALAPADVANAFKRGLHFAENHLSVEPKRIGYGQDDAEGSKRRNRDIDIKGAD